METYERAGLRFRPATPDDAAFVADCLTAIRPQAPVDALVLRHEWANPDPTWTNERYVVERAGARIGWAGIDRPRWELSAERFAGLWGDLQPSERSAERLDQVFAFMEERAAAAGAVRLVTRSNEDDDFRSGVILARGFREDRRARRWELDLVAERVRILAMTEDCRARMRDAGIRLTTLAADGDPERYRQIWRMSDEAAQDIPTTLPHVPESFESYAAWFRSPDIHEDRFWIARLDGALVGVSVLAYPPVRGVVGTAWTATARSVRGRGVARALKCETLTQAIALGVDRVRTGNDAANDPILHINRTMGYRPIAGAIGYLKDVT